MTHSKKPSYHSPVYLWDRMLHETDDLKKAVNTALKACNSEWVESLNNHHCSHIPIEIIKENATLEAKIALRRWLEGEEDE